MDIKNATLDELQIVGEELLQRHIELFGCDKWIPLKSIDGIKNWILHPSDGTISMVRAESHIQCSAKDLFDFLITNIDKTCTQWNDVMYYSGSIKQYGNGFELSRIISEGNIVADREDVFLRYSGQLEDGSLFEVSKGYGEDVEPMAKHIAKYMVRSDMHFASKEFKPISENSCYYKVIWHYDPAGLLSKLIPKKAFGKMILKNLIHEHQKLAGIFNSHQGAIEIDRPRLEKKAN